MPWYDTPCDTFARKTNGTASAHERSGRVLSGQLKAYWCRYYKKPWPEDMFALHHCDNPKCSNPEHVFPGTQSENVMDSVNKGRSIAPRGELHRLAKLTSEDVIAIRARCAVEPQTKVAKSYGLDPSAISRIVNNKRWAHLGGGSNAV